MRLTQKNNDQDAIFQAYQDAHVFLLDASFHNGKEVPLTDDNAIFFGKPLPFKTCYFEIANPDLFLVTSKNTDGTADIDVAAMLVTEKQPGVLFCVVIGKGSSGNMVYSGTITAHEVRRETEMRLAAALLNLISSYIHECKLGTEQVFKTVNISSPRKCQHKLNSIIRLTPHTAKNYPPPLLSSHIEWTVAWWVRGHWRKIDGVGKDRYGAYVTYGFTWVTEHLRGDVDGQIKQHTYKLESTCHVY